MRVRNGDTLVEVLFAFAILSLIISVMFSGALSSYKSAVTAQERTQAQFLAQYQADALKTYRDSLEWDSSANPLASYLDGGSAALSAMRNPTQPFCMQFNPSNASTPRNYWSVQSNEGTCSSDAKVLAPNLTDLKIQIRLSLSGVSQTATITVSWQPKNSKSSESVVNTILLTKQR